MRKPTLIVVSPAHCCSAQLPIAAARAGDVGILDLSYEQDELVRSDALSSLRQYANAKQGWGVRCDACGDAQQALESLGTLAESPWPLLIVAGVGVTAEALTDICQRANQLADRVYLEVHDLPAAVAAEQAGFDGVIVKGHEAGGRVGSESTFVLLQQLHGRVKLPYYVQGGIGPDTAAAAVMAGAAGVVLCEELWLTTESPLDRRERQQWSCLDGSETAVVGDTNTQYRFYSRSDRNQVREIDEAVLDGGNWEATIHCKLSTGSVDQSNRLIPMGQGIAYASTLAEQHTNVAGVLAAYRDRALENIQLAQRQQSLRPESELAQAHATRYPILQGPMTRVSDVSKFCKSVGEGGALPFLALALMRGREVEKLLAETKRELGQTPWGVGILGFAPAELRAEQLEEIHKANPPFAIIAGGRPSQATRLEEQGISTYLHVPSPGLLEAFIRDGARKIILEGRECGGHVGPRSSFVLWQSAIDVLLNADIDDPRAFQIVFAGGIHDALSAAMVSALAAPLVARGMKIGVLMGTAYLFTPEAVSCGAITAEYQRQALECRKTVLLETGVGHATRCLETPFAVEFDEKKRELTRAGKSPDEIRIGLEMLNIGRLRLASKGLERTSQPGNRNGKGELVAHDAEEQRRRGMYMIGQIAALRAESIPVAQLHEDVSGGCVRVLNKLKKRTRKAAPRRQRPGTPIAIVGLAGIFPDALDLRQFWENIVEGHSAIKEVPSDRWEIANYFDKDRNAPDQVYSKWGAFLPAIKFDALRWRIPPASLPSIDPMQLLSLQVAWDAMVDAGYDRRSFARERTGAIFAVSGANERGGEYAVRTMMREYLPKLGGQTQASREQLLSELEGILPEWTEDSFAGFLQNVIAGRIANRFDLGGPNFVVDAACASSMAAIQASVDQLRLNNCDMILVGAADGTNNPFGYMSFAKTHALSPQGKSRPFDDATDGIVLGEGVAAAVLKRLPDAERDGDQIHAVIKGVGASSDGLNRSMTAPFAAGQVRALERAYEDAGVSPSTVSLIEAHGTGTALGDRTELTALSEFFSEASQQTVAVGSIKSMIGHTKATAGMASLVKTTLALSQRVLPPTINVELPNQEIDFVNGPCYVNSEARPWIKSKEQEQRRAGISAFGFGGTNFHLVMEEYGGRYHHNLDYDWAPRSAEVFVWSDPDRQRIVRKLREFDEQLQNAEEADLAQLASAHFNDTTNWTSSVGCCRLALVAESIEDLHSKVKRAIDRLPEESCWNDPSGIYCSDAAAVTQDQVCFLYPGQGSQAVNMLRDLVVSSPWAAADLHSADEQTQDAFDQPLTRYIFPTPAFDDATKAEQRERLNDTQVAQPALGVIELFATDLLARFGIRPGVAAGHSYGEYPALYAAGVLSREDLLRHSVFRGQISAESAKQGAGTMAAVIGPAEQVRAEVEAMDVDVHVANHNGPQQTIIAGSVRNIETAIERLAQHGFRTRRLSVTAAFHTPMMKVAADKLVQHLAQTPSSLNSPQLPVYSNTLADQYPDDSETIRATLGRHIAEPVRFEEQVRTMHDRGARLFFEVGPGRVLSGMVGRILDGQPHTVLPLEVAGREGWTQLAHLVAQTAALGLEIRLDAWFERRGLFEGSVADYLEQLAAKHRPKATEWIVNPCRVRPALPAQPAEANRARAGKETARTTQRATLDNSVTVAQARAAAKPTPTSTPSNQPKKHVAPAVAHTRSSNSIPQESSIKSSHAPGHPMSSSDLSYAAGTSQPHANGTGHSQFAADLLPLVHSQLSQWMALQASQQNVTERMLAMQERILAAAMQGSATLPPLRPVLPTPPAAHAEIPPAVRFEAPGSSSNGSTPQVADVAPSPQPQVIRKPPIPVPVAGEPAPPTVVTTSSTPAVQTRPAVPVSAAPEPVTAATPQTNGQPPSAETFRDALLQAISERTGYPADVLDENVPLESGLGIDSIKKVEIFSNLKQYHEYFQDEDSTEEDVLEQFSQLKTLQDIVEYYAKRRLSHTTDSTDSDAHTSGNGSAAKPNQVQRMTLTAVESPLVAGNGKKKTSPRIT